jgi:hypothetical protein
MASLGYKVKHQLGSFFRSCMPDLSSIFSPPPPVPKNNGASQAMKDKMRERFRKPSDLHTMELQASSPETRGRTPSCDITTQFPYPIPTADSPRRSGSTSRSALPLSSEGIDPQTLAEIVDSLDRTLGHVPYAVSGLAAMALWGFADRPPVRVSIMCPEHSKEVIKSWAVANGAEYDAADPSSLGIFTAGEVLRRVRIKYLRAEDFDRLPVTRRAVPIRRSGAGPVARARYEDVLAGRAAASTMRQQAEDDGFTRPRVLGLAAVINFAAHGYKHDERARKSQRTRRAVGEDILWAAERLAQGLAEGEEGVGPLSPATVPEVIDPLFWEPFTAEYRPAARLFFQAGLSLPGNNPYDDPFATQRVEERPATQSQGPAARAIATRSNSSRKRKVAAEVQAGPLANVFRED